jgi:hypothetical protein
MGWQETPAVEVQTMGSAQAWLAEIAGLAAAGEG